MYLILSFSAPWQKSFILIHYAVHVHAFVLISFHVLQSLSICLYIHAISKIVYVLYRRVLLFHRIWFGVCKTTGNPGLAGKLRAQPSIRDFSSTPLSIQNKRLCQCQHYRVQQIVVITVQVFSGNRKPILQDFIHTLSRHSILLHLLSCTKWHANHSQGPRNLLQTVEQTISAWKISGLSCKIHWSWQNSNVHDYIVQICVHDCSRCIHDSRMPFSVS